MSRDSENSRFAEPDFVAHLRGGDRDAVREVVRAYLPHILRAALGAGLGDERAGRRDLRRRAAPLHRGLHRGIEGEAAAGFRPARGRGPGHRGNL